MIQVYSGLVLQILSSLFVALGSMELSKILKRYFDFVLFAHKNIAYTQISDIEFYLLLN